MARDTNLVLTTGGTAGQAISTSTQGTAISVTGGEFALFTLYSAVTPTDADETIAIQIQASFNAGSTWVTLTSFPTLSKAADKGNAGTRVAMACYVPRANTPNARGSDTPVQVRWKSTVAGTTPSYTLLIEMTHLSGASYGQIGNTGVGRTGMLDNVKNFVA
jgi:hypothetical protein